MRAALGGPLDEPAFKDLLVQGIRGWVGRTEDDLMELGEQLFAQEIAGALFHGAWRLVRAHQNRGHTVVIATSATRMQVQPMARELGIDHVLCTELETEHGVLTGGIAGRPPWGEGKLAAVREFARRQRIPLKNCHAYANGDEDVPFLDVVGFPHPVNPGSDLARHAASADGTSVRFSDQAKPIPSDGAGRTTALFGSFAAAVGAGAVAGVLTLRPSWRDGPGHFPVRPRRRAIGQYPVRGHRRAAHHASSRGVLHQSPEHADRRAGHLTSRATGLHRGGQGRGEANTGARDSCSHWPTSPSWTAPTRRRPSRRCSPRWRSYVPGVSIVLAPEGTRSLSPRVGAFKKGGFHLARDAGVPIVPIVIRNAGEIMWRNAKVAQEGTIEVVVHEPVPTARLDAKPTSTSGYRECASCTSIPSTIGRASTPGNSGRTMIAKASAEAGDDGAAGSPHAAAAPERVRHWAVARRS